MLTLLSNPVLEKLFSSRKIELNIVFVQNIGVEAYRWINLVFSRDFSLNLFMSTMIFGVS